MKKLIYKQPVIFSIMWTLLIFVLCATPGRFIPSANWLDLLSFDKFVHAGMFFVLCSLLFISAIKYNRPPAVFIVVFLFCVLYGGLLEVMQAKCFSNRSADWQDFIANSFGCVIAVLCLKKSRIYFQKKN